MLRFGWLAAALLLIPPVGPEPRPADDSPLKGVRRVVFLGDSITYSGQYVEFVEAALRLKDPTLPCEFLNMGLPSETVSGLSEPGHAGGKFPRPDLHERLDRVLDRSKPDLVVACYGMNDGIYYPFSEERFRRFQEGLRFLRDRARASGARVLHLTPPVFDPMPIRSKTLPAGLSEYPQPFEGYDEVLGRYSDWLIARRSEGWEVVDVHGPMKAFLAKQRERDPGFHLAGDGVHANPTGHAIMACEILRVWKLPAPEVSADPEGLDRAFAPGPGGREVLGLVRGKQRLLKDAWLTDTGHKRPGMKAGLPREEAERQAARLEAEIVERRRRDP